MHTLLEGICSHWTGSGTLSGIPGPYLGAAPQAATYPYAVMLDNGGTITETFDARTLQAVSVTFRIYHTDMDVLHQYQVALHDRFDRGSFNLGVGIMRSAKRINSFRGIAGLDKNNKAIYVASSLYRFTVQDVF